MAGDRAAQALVVDTLRAVKLLQVPLRCNRKVSDAEIVRVLMTSPSIKVAAGRLEIDRATVARRVKALMRHCSSDAALARAPSLQRSLAKRATTKCEDTDCE